VKQIGQILVDHGWVDPAALARALAEQPRTARRICSLLILRGALDPDHAARALSEQHGVPGVLQKHLEYRDLALPSLLPAEFARHRVALPIGRTSTGALIVCVRDPRPDLLAAITQAVTGPVVVAVAPAYQLEHLVRETYNTDPATADELVLELDLSTPPAGFVHVPGAPPLPAAPAAPAAGDDDDVDVDLTTRRIPLIGDPLDHLGTMTLVELDDARVAKDPSQSGQHEALLPRAMTSSMAPSAAAGPVRTVTSSYPPRFPGAAAAHPMARRSATPPRGSPVPALEAAAAAIAGAASLDDATDAAMFYLAGRFHHAVWFAVHDGAALGERGHGDQLTADVVQAIAVPLRAPSLVQVAHDTRRLATSAPLDAGPIQDRLWRTLGAPLAPAALPIELDGRIAAVIAVGDPLGDPATAAADLERLGQALTAAFRRIAAR
jgi:hypothetical protein